MLYVALAELAVLAITVLAFAGLLRSKERECSRREALMVDKMLNLAGKPWTPAPADSPQPHVERELEPAFYTTSPEMEF